MLFEKVSCYKLLRGDIECSLTDYVKSKYGVFMKLSVHFNSSSALPIQIKINKGSSPKLWGAWVDLCHDLVSIESIGNDFEEEIGHKLLQMYFGCKIDEYVFDAMDKEDDKEFVYLITDDYEPIRKECDIVVQKSIAELGLNSQTYQMAR